MNRSLKISLFVIGLAGIGYIYYNRGDISKAGKKFLIGEEGVLLNPYKDIYGNWTIGIGHLIKLPQERELLNGISPLKLKLLFLSDLIKAKKAVRQSIKVPLKRWERDALIVIAFNIGGDRFKKSALVRAINNKKSEKEIIKGFSFWHSGGDLEERRTREARLFLTGNYSNKLTSADTQKFFIKPE